VTLRFDVVAQMPFGSKTVGSIDVADEVGLLAAIERSLPTLIRTQATLAPTSADALDLMLRLSPRRVTP
jgi:hypothetical protein